MTNVWVCMCVWCVCKCAYEHVFYVFEYLCHCVHVFLSVSMDSMCSYVCVYIAFECGHVCYIPVCVCVSHTLFLHLLWGVYLHMHTHSSSDTAASVECLQCIQILQTYEANFGVNSVHGATPMHKAAASGYVGQSVHLCTFDLCILVCDRAIPGQS